MAIILKSFLSGFLSTLIFHQGFLGILFAVGVTPKPPFNMSPTEPFGIPSVISLALFGGLWGIIIWQLVRKSVGKRHWIKSIAFGAIGPTAVAFLVVLPLKGMDFQPIFIVMGLIINGLWGFGNSLIMRFIK